MGILENEKHKKIGNRIKTRREELSLTQQDIGDMVGLNKSTIARYERGQISQIKLPVIYAISKAPNVDAGWLLLKSSNKTQTSANKTDKTDDIVIVSDYNEKLLIYTYRTVTEQGKKYLLQSAELAKKTYKNNDTTK